MSYYVSLGDVDFDNVVSVTQAGERDISVYDSVGGGKFAVPQNKGLRTWAIKFQTDDSDMFDDFDKMLRKKTPARLIVKSDNDKVSERVLLKSYSKEESEYAGVYNVTASVLEYVKAAVKTADGPYVAREGNKVLAATVTIGDGTGGTMTPYDVAKYVQDMARAAGDDAEAAKQMALGYIDPETGKEINPATLNVGDAAIIKSKYTSAWEQEYKKEQSKAVLSVEQQSAIRKGAQKTWNAMSKAITEWDKKQQERLRENNTSNPGGNSGV